MRHLMRSRSTNGQEQGQEARVGEEEAEGEDGAEEGEGEGEDEVTETDEFAIIEFSASRLI